MSLASRKLVLFDIDGTLVRSIPDNPHAKAFTRAIENLYHEKTQLHWESVAGLTDRLIFRQILESIGWNDEAITRALPVLVDELEKVYAASFTLGSVQVMPGVKGLLEELRSRDIMLGLLTGNLYEIAKLKLVDAGIFHFFEVGGYGSDDHTARSELVQIAARRAQMHNRLGEVYLIGDTPRDITAARDAGVHHAIGYSASHYNKDSLLKAGAESVITTFEDQDLALKALCVV